MIGAQRMIVGGGAYLRSAGATRATRALAWNLAAAGATRAAYAEVDAMQAMMNCAGEQQFRVGNGSCDGLCASGLVSRR